MIGERENKYTDTEYGTLHMRSFVIDGNEINAFYDSSDDLVFVLDNTVNTNKPNVLLVMNPDGDRKWDEILSNDYDVDLETIRPKQDNKYQKLDIEYSGLNVYEELINAYNSGDDLTEELNQLNVLRNSAVRHSAMVRLNAANEIISKTNTTIVKTKETIIRLQERIKTLRAKLTATKKEIGRVSTKQSAAQILKLESQIEALTEKLKRAKKRLSSAQKRLETATIDAELASELLNQPALEIKTVTKRAVKNKSVMVAPKHAVQKVETEPDDEEDDDVDEYDEVAEDESDADVNDDVNDDNDVKPLFDSDPQILNEDIAFKPISFEAPVVSEQKQQMPEPVIPNVPELSEPEPETPQIESYSAPELPQPETHEEIPYLNDVFVAPEMPEPTEPVSQQNTEEQTSEKPMLESLAPISNIPESTPDYGQLTEDMIEEKPTNEPSVLESMTPIERQSEPVVAEEHETVIESEPIRNVATQNNNLVAPMTESMHDSMVGEDNNKRKPTLIYYLLLIVLIALSVFTLWLYQNNTTNTAPTLSATVEKATVLKKTEKTEKAKKVAEPAVKDTEEDADEDVFFDEEPTTDDTDTVNVSETTEVPEPEESEPDVVLEPSEPVVIDAVPARVTSSGVSEESEKEIASEEEILAKKPVYEPGNKHDAMFVGTDADEQEYEDEVEYPDMVATDSGDNEIIYYDEDDPFYDAEEAAYQAEQAELEYDE